MWESKLTLDKILMAFFWGIIIRDSRIYKSIPTLIHNTLNRDKLNCNIVYAAH